MKFTAHIHDITSVIRAPAENEYEDFGRVFHRPQHILRIDISGPPITVGETREYMVEYVDSIIHEAAPKFDSTPRASGWDKEALLEAIRTMPDHRDNLVTELLPVSAWQWDLYTPDQNQGMTLGLTAAQVGADHFGAHTMTGIRSLMRESGATLEEAYSAMRGLDKPQVVGMINYGLSRAHVEMPSFGLHTLKGVKRLREDDGALSIQDAYSSIEGLDKFQLEGNLNFGLSRAQVEVANFGDIR